MSRRPARRHPAGLLAWAVLAAWSLVALGADFLASDRPLYLELDGERYLLCNLIDHEELRGLRGDELERRLGPGDRALWAPVRHDPAQVRTAGELEILAGPSARHLLGTDDRGRDVLARLIHGSRVSLLVALGAALLSLVAGAALGLLAAGAPRWLDGALVASWDAAAAVPAVLLVVGVQGLLGAGGVTAMILLIALPRAADSARLTRGAILGALRQPYAEAARAAGAGRARLLLRHALPQARAPLAVAAALTGATAVLSEAALGFLGFGAAPPTASWGELLRQAHESGLAPHLALPAGLAITTLAAALLHLGDQRAARPANEISSPREEARTVNDTSS